MAKPDKVAEAADYKVVLAKAADLVPYARNTRTHSDEQVAKIMASLVEFGFTKPVLVDQKGIVAGHGTTQAALRLYEQGKTINTPAGKALPLGYVPTLDCTGWTEAQRKAYIIADNAIAAEAGWDAALLNIEIKELESLKFNVGLLGFSTENLNIALGLDGDLGGEEPHSEDPTRPEEAPEGQQLAVQVLCTDVAHQQEVYETLHAEGYQVKVVLV
jgi:ParB-like nuclease family protein